MEKQLDGIKTVLILMLMFMVFQAAVHDCCTMPAVLERVERIVNGIPFSNERLKRINDTLDYRLMRLEEKKCVR